jgi:hypothetical protein
LDKCSPIFPIGGLVDTVLEGAIAVNGGVVHAFKEELQILYHGVLGVSLWAAYSSLVVATGRDHATQWSVVGTSNSLPNEVKFLGGNHVFDIWDIVEYASYLSISNSLFLHTCHVDGRAP